MLGVEHWREEYEGGSPEAERLLFASLARDILALQATAKRRTGAGGVVRAFHAGSLLGTDTATLTFGDELPGALHTGFAQPGAAYTTTVRFSNDNAHAGGGGLCGVSLRVNVASGVSHDLLMTNAPVLAARTARQYVGFAVATSGGGAGRIFRLPGLIRALGISETARMLRHAKATRRRVVRSLALETYWSGGAIRWGDKLAVRYSLRPQNRAEADLDSPNDLRDDLARRLRDGPVGFDLYVQPFVDDVRTPIEDASIAWDEAVSRPVMIATLTIPRQDLGSVGALAAERRVEQLAFSPWHTTEEFRPLGNLNRARKAAYAASAAHRLSYRFVTEEPLRNRIFGGLARAAFSGLNRYVPWYRLPLDISLLNLAGLRHTLRQQNLIDTEPREAPPAALPLSASIGESAFSARTYDGSYNDLSDPKMGAIGATFGRNMKATYRPDLFDSPNPITVSRELLYRESFLPARSLNILAAAWIQFQVHDWVNHARYPLGQRDVVVPLPPDMTWQSKVGGPFETVMRLGGNREHSNAPPANGAAPILFGNNASHWWDGSEIYGPTEVEARQLREKRSANGNPREGAKLRLDHGYLPEDINGQEVTGFNESWWLGLSAMHTLFAREHNAVCDALRSAYSHLSDERVYQTARLVVSALIAKIHTVEWTPAILATKAIDVGLKANWYGPPKDWLARLGLWLTDAHSLTGIPQTLPDHHAAPYSLTEEFVTVYRMHPLLPDDYLLFDHADGGLLRRFGFLDLQGKKTDQVMRDARLENVLYSLGIAYPGAVTLHNFPRTLQAFEREGERIDLSVVDLVRTRRRGVPRYNQFRQSLHKAPVRRWEDLTENPESVRRLKDVYKEIDLVDTMVGLFAETPPEGFGFSDTAFRIFILMASRRLQSDRFLTVDFRPEIYTPLGIDWVAQNGMTSVILRHFPELAGVLPRTASAFAPWRPITPH